MRVMTDSVEQELAGLAKARGLKLGFRQLAPDRIEAAFMDDDGVIILAASAGDRDRALDALRIAAQEASPRKQS